MNDAPPLLVVRVRQVVREAEGINTYELADPAGRPLPPFTAGAHIDVHVPGGPLRQYSLCNDPVESDRYVIGVQRDAASRGGSSRMHDAVGPGQTLVISSPRNNFPLHEAAQHHTLIAGGIGVTPMLAMAWRLAAQGASWHLHYCAREPARTAFLERFKQPPFSGHVSFHFDGGDPSKGLDLKATLKAQRAGEHLYCCGPTGLMEAVKAAASHWVPGSVHFEYFTNANAEPPPGGNKPFRVRLARSGKVFEVPADKSLMHVLRANGFDIDSSCEEGICGTCATRVVKGEVDHRDMVLSDEEKATNGWMMVCCSRAKGDELELDL